jgi:hypothetical protein
MKHTNAGLRRKKPMGELYADPTREVRLILHSEARAPRRHRYRANLQEQVEAAAIELTPLIQMLEQAKSLLDRVYHGPNGSISATTPTIGKALGSLDSGTGVFKVLISLQ